MAKAKTMDPSNPASPTPWDPDGDGDDDSNPEGDTDNDFWTPEGVPIAGAWHAVGKSPPPSEMNSAEYDPFEVRADAKYSMPDGSYPIDNCAQLTSAANLAHHSKTYSFAQVKAHVMKALAGLSCPMSALPDTWSSENSAESNGDTRERPPREGLFRAIGDLEVRAGGDGPGTLVGHLAVFNQWSEINSIHEGHFMERLDPQAFNRTIQNNGSRMKVTFNHGKDPSLGDKVLGIPTVLEPDDYGVRYEVPLFDTQYNRELAPGLKAGAYGSSFRFNVLSDDFNKKPGRSEHNPNGIPERTVKEVRMQEFGPVTFPAYEGASAGMRSLTDRFTLTQYLEDPGKLGPLVDSIVDGDLTPPAARGIQSAPASASPSAAVATKPRRLKPVRKPTEQRSEKPPMDKAERRARITELEEWVRATNETYENDAMPPDVKLDWRRTTPSSTSTGPLWSSSRPVRRASSRSPTRRSSPAATG